MASESRPRDHRDKSEIVADLECLSHQDGFIYTFCTLVFKSLCMSVDEIADINWNERLNRQELSFLLGLMVKRPLKLTEPPSMEAVERQAKSASDFLEELHHAVVFPTDLGMLDVRNARPDGSVDFSRRYDEWMQGGEGMVEPIFYGEDGAYDFQYLEMAKRRYANDAEWIEAHLGTSFATILEIAKQLRQLAQVRINALEPPSTFQEFCESLMSLLCFVPEDLTGLGQESIDCFLKTFALTPGTVNQAFDSVGAYNIVHSHPVIRLENSRCFLPIHFQPRRIHLRESLLLDVGGRSIQ